MVLVKILKFFHVFIFGKISQQNVLTFLESKKASLDYKKQKVEKVEKSGFFIFPKGLVHGFGKKFEIFPCFHFSQKNSQQNVFGDILDILESKKAFFKSRTCSDRIKKR